jgi:eukaryotic-like serine/threonine-protein kinase
MLHVGSTLSERYILREVIARGGMGEVWRADDAEQNRPVAIKTLLPALSGDPGFAQRFRNEVRAMAVLRDPAIVEIQDFGSSDGIDYIVMTYVEGESLRSLMSREGPLAPDRAMALIAQAAGALHLAHEQGIVHRDVKPSNFMVSPDGRVVLTDFGIARMVDTTRMTEVGSVLGTVTYLSPEQITGDPVSPATDVYALGVVAYECIAGVPPFRGRGPLEVAMSHTQDEPPPLPDHAPFPVRRIVLRALAKDPADRWPTAAAMASAAAKAAMVAPRPTARSGRPTRVRPASTETPAPEVAAPDVAAPAPAKDPASAKGKTRTRWRRGTLLLVIGMASALGVSATLMALHGSRSATVAGQHQVDAALAAPEPVGEMAPASVVPTGSPTPVPRPSRTQTPTRKATARQSQTAADQSTTTAAPATTTTEPITTTTSEPPSSSPPAQVTLLDYTNWHETDAVASLTGAGLVPSVVYQPSTDCLVISQSVPAGTAVDPGTAVALTVGTAEACATP